MAYVLYINDAPLRIENIRWVKPGQVKSAIVVNGGWSFRIKGDKLFISEDDSDDYQIIRTSELVEVDCDDCDDSEVIFQADKFKNKTPFLPGVLA